MSRRYSEPKTSPFFLPVRAIYHLPFEERSPSIKWKQLASAFHWAAGRSKHPPTGDRFFAILAWMRASPSLKSWTTSGRCLVSPKTWPRDVLPFFQRRLVPTPYEVINLIYPGNCFQFPLFSWSKEQEEGVLRVLLYCMGFTLDEIHEHPSTALRSIAVGVDWLSRDPRFLVWATGTDFNRSVLPFKLGSNLKQQASISKRLKRNPLLLSKEEARPLVESPAALTYLIYSTHKQPRLTPTNSHTITIGVFDAE